MSKMLLPRSYVSLPSRSVWPVRRRAAVHGLVWPHILDVCHNTVHVLTASQESTGHEPSNICQRMAGFLFGGGWGGEGEVGWWWTSFYQARHKGTVKCADGDIANQAGYIIRKGGGWGWSSRGVLKGY